MSVKISFQDDYSYLAHPRILKALERAQDEPHKTYGTDLYSQKAADILRQKTKSDSDVHFISGGTLTNLINLAHILKPYESIISCDSGHIATHETGAIEATGHKVHTVENQDGKLTVAGIAEIIDTHQDEHMVVPRVVYLSQSTERGTIYFKKEIEDISKYCRENALYLYIDGARIASALASDACDFTLCDIAELCDVFYFGGTKIGLLFGEAAIICNDTLKHSYRYGLKQRGGMLAKGATLGVQFHELLKDDLYIELARHANVMAQSIEQVFADCGYQADIPCQSNQFFVTLPEELVERLERDFTFLRWSQNKDMITIRLVTSWASKQYDIDEFTNALRSATKP
ncbi:MAG: threonine aldolase family protein [Alphaproteobacteria bacterium]